MRRPRVIIPLTVQFSVRYLLRTGLLARIGTYAQPVVVIRWQDEGLRRELEGIGAEVHLLPEVFFGNNYQLILRRINFVHHLRLNSPSRAISRRVKHKTLSLNRWQRLRTQTHEILVGLSSRLPGYVEHLTNMEQFLRSTETNISEFERLVDQAQPDVLFSITPFQPEEHLLLQAAGAANIPSATSILSFDNLTKRGWIPIVFDAYCLWNQYNEQHLYRAYPEARTRKVTIVGAPQFDFYSDKSLIWSEDEWRHRVSLPTGRPVILYAAGHWTFLPQEPHWLRQIDNAVECGEIPGKPVILLRRHPNDVPGRWLELMRDARNIVYDEPWPDGASNRAYTNITMEDIQKLASTLFHTRVHVNACSTMAIDGAIFDKPQVGPAYDDRPGNPFDRTTRDLYRQEHYQPITASGGLALAHSRAELVHEIRDGLQNPSRLSEGRKRLVRDLITYQDGCCTQRVDDALREFVAGHCR